MSLFLFIFITGLGLEIFFYSVGKVCAMEGLISPDLQENIFFGKALQPFSLSSPQSQLSKKERIIHELDFTSLADILLGSDLSLKRGAIEKLYQLKTRDSINLLLEHRQNSHPDVRFYVTSALERIKHDYESDFHSAYLEMKKDIYKNSARLLLAKRYIEYRYSGLLDEGLNKKYFEESLFHLRIIVKSAVPLEEAHWIILDLYKEQPFKYKTDIFDIIQRLESHGADQERIQRAKAEFLFLLQNYESMKKVLVSLSKDPDFGSLASWWGASV